MKQTGILHLSNGRAFIGIPDEQQSISLKKSITNGSFSYAGEDYRQATINKDIADAIPKPEDFLPFNFRHLSATIVGAGSWKATDFTDEKVLKKAAKLLSFKPVMVNHQFETSNIIGANGELKFVKSRIQSDGTEIPGGIEGPIWIDGKLHADVCRKLAAFPVPHIQSVSVTIVFEWEPSHDFQRDGEYDWYGFRENLGTAVNGKMVCRKVTDVIEAYETSLVWLGADPFAKIMDSEGNLLNIEQSSVVSMSKPDSDPLFSIYESEGRMFIHEGESYSKKLSYSSDKYSKKGINGKNEEMEVLKLLAEKFGKTEKEITADFVGTLQLITPEQKVVEATAYSKMESDLTAATTGKETAEASLATAETDLTEVKGKLVEFEKICKHEDIATLETEVGVSNIVAYAKDAFKKLSASRAEAERLYKLSAGENITDAMLNSIKTANSELAESYVQQFGGKSMEAFGATCQKCGSDKISMRKTKPEGENKGAENSIPSMAQYLHDNQ